MKKLGIVFFLLVVLTTNTALADTLPPQIYSADSTLNQIVYGTQMDSESLTFTPRGGFIEGSEEIPDPDAGLYDLLSDYYSLHGYYWQGLRSHLQIPEAISPTIPNNLESHPTDLQDDWLDLGALSPTQTVNVALTVNSYVNSSGAGAEVVAETIITGVLWTRTINLFGSETWRTHGWVSTTQTLLLEAIPIPPQIEPTPLFISIIATPQPAATRKPPTIEGGR